MKPSRSLNTQKKRREITGIGIMILFSIPILFAYFIFFSNAFIDQKTGELTLQNFQFLTQEIQLSQHTVPPMGEAFRNTVIFTLIVSVAELAISCLAGYALARMSFKGKNFITYSLLALRLFPGVLLLIGVLYVLMFLKVVNSLQGVVIVAIALRLPGSTFIIRNFFLEIPNDVENSTLVDGCNRLTSFYQVIIHMVKPGLATIGLFSFMSGWSNYILFNVLIFNSKTPVLATYIRVLSRNDQMIADYGVFSAMAFIYMLPVIIFFFISQKQLMQSNLGGGKGI